MMGKRSVRDFARRGLSMVLMLAPMLFLAVFFFYPLGAILKLSLFPEGSAQLGVFREIIETDRKSVV